MSSQSQQTGVYIKDKQYGWLPANVISIDTAKATATVKALVPNKNNDGSDSVSYTKEERIVKLKDYSETSQTLPLQNILENGKLMVVQDMCDLPSLHEAAIMYNLKARHEGMEPYTRVGDIVIAMNPFQWIQELYSPDQKSLYIESLITSSSSSSNKHGSGDPRQNLSPHIYEVSSLAYRGLAMNQTHQSILVSGESGAGKTESVKIIMNHLAGINSHIDMSNYTSMHDHDNSNSNNAETDGVVKRVLDSNPLLEAFGNAKTMRNDNSSRFGKYIQLQFDVEDPDVAAFSGKSIPGCILAGSICETYLLEKSRVVMNAGGSDSDDSGSHKSERSYHIFYQLLGAPEEEKNEIWDGIQSKTPKDFVYVHTDSDEEVTIEGMKDGERWPKTIEALSLIGITGDKLLHLMRAICTVLQLGNLTFGQDASNEDGSAITSVEEVQKLASLMGIASVEDIEKALTFRTITAGKESYSVPQRENMARDSRDAFAKAIYQHVFDWLVKEINAATCAERNYGEAAFRDFRDGENNDDREGGLEAEADEERYGLIGLLDIFGFETFDVNRFEQFSINYANEKLQQKYNLDIFSSVQNEYEYEGIEMPPVNFLDNSEVLHLIEGRMGLISLINEECLRPHGNDASFVSKVRTVNKDIDCLIKNPLHTPTQFAVAHYAGAVVYEATYFVQKNTDKLPNDLIRCATLSSNPLIQTGLVHNEIVSSGNQGKARHSSQSVSSKFRSQLHKLMQTIQKTRTRYVRCIKPNPAKVPLEVDLLSSVQQLRCAGVVAAVTISRVSFPNRLMHETVMDRFACIAKEREIQDILEPEDEKEEKCETPDEAGDGQNVVKELVRDILSDYDGEGSVEDSYACGKSRVYFKAGVLEFLESKRMVKLGEYATRMQRIVRGFVAESKYLRMVDTCIYLQSLARRNKARNDFYRACYAVTTISCWVRCINARKELGELRQKRASTLIQTRFRIMMAKRVLRQCVAGAIAMQKIWRGALQRPIYRSMLAEAEEEARVNTKIAALQKRLADAEMKWIKADKARIIAEKRVSGDGHTAVSSSEEASDEVEGKNTESGVGGGGNKELLDESTKMIEYLQKENFKLRSKGYLLKTDLNELKTSYANLSEQYRVLHDSHEAVRQYATEMSHANMKLNVKNVDLKKKYSEIKKLYKTSGMENKSEIQKLKDLMNAKDKDNGLEISRLQAEIASLLAGSERRVTPRSRGQNGKLPPSGKSSNQKKKKSGRRSPKPLQVDTKARARVHGRKSPELAYFPRIDSVPSMVDDDERWGHDGFFELENEANDKSGNKKPRSRRSRKKKSASPSAVPNSSLGRRLVSPHQSHGSKIKQKASLSSSVHSEASTSSLQDATDTNSNKGKNSSRPSSRNRSSLAVAAAAKPSSLASRARKK